MYVEDSGNGGVFSGKKASAVNSTKTNRWILTMKTYNYSQKHITNTLSTLCNRNAVTIYNYHICKLPFSTKLIQKEFQKYTKYMHFTHHINY